MNPYVGVSQLFHSFSDIHRIAPQAVKLGDNQHVAIFHAIKQSGETWPLTGCNRTSYMFLNQSLGLDGESGSLDFSSLIFGGLFHSRDPTVGKTRDI